MDSKCNIDSNIMPVPINDDGDDANNGDGKNTNEENREIIQSSSSIPRPLFLTQKLRVDNLTEKYNIFDFQLRDHLRNTSDLFLVKCKCYHTHNKQHCPFTTEAVCLKCDIRNELFIKYQTFLFHPDVMIKKLAKCCKHVHYPPCNVCIGCREDGKTCIIQKEYVCEYTTSTVCNNNNIDENVHFTKNIEYNEMIQEHMFNTDNLTMSDMRSSSSSKGYFKRKRGKIYFCDRHHHTHFHENKSLRNLTCFIQTTKCCNNQIELTNFPSSFILTTVGFKNSELSSIMDISSNFAFQPNTSITTTTDMKKKTKIVSNNGNGGNNDNDDNNNNNEETIEIRRKRKYTKRNTLLKINNNSYKRFKYTNNNNNNNDDLESCDTSNALVSTLYENDLSERIYDDGINTSNAILQLKQDPNLIIKTYVIYAPNLWRDQSTNYFILLLKAAISMPNLVAERYKRFESANYKINVKKYKGGKLSIIRLAITGFETKGLYQTATISCTLPRDVVLIPEKIYVLLEGKYDLSLVLVKRDPSLKQTCMFVCRAIRNEDKSNDTIVISHEIAKSLQQDQDGDKNGIYLLPYEKALNYDRRESFQHKIAKMEMAIAFDYDKTLVATPRFSISDINHLTIFESHDELLAKDEFYRRTHAETPE